MNHSEYGLSLESFRGSNIEKAFQQDNIQKAQSKSQKDKVSKVMKEFKEGKLKSSSGNKVTTKEQALAIAMNEAGISKANMSDEQLKEMIKEHEQLVDVLDSPSHEDDKKESKKQKKELKEYKESLKKAYDILGIKSDLEKLNDQIFKSDVESSFGYGNFPESIKISKKGSDIKLMAEIKYDHYKDKYYQIESKKESIKQKLTEKGIEFIQGEYDENPSYRYQDYENDINMLSLIDQYNDLKWQCRDIKRDLKSLKVLMSDIEDNKKYDLTVTQIASLKVD